jgi:hypothetical protein
MLPLRLSVVFLAASSFAGFLPEIASSISFCPVAAFLGFFGTWLRRPILADAPKQRPVDDVADGGTLIGDDRPTILNSRLNFRRCMTHLRLHEPPNLGVHQTGSSSTGEISLPVAGVGSTT